MRSNKEWEAWGRLDPFWSVASWPGRHRAGPAPWTAEEFLALGAADFQDILGHWRHFGFEKGTCLEIGCGAGRMTRQLANVFDHVIALDVSADQIAIARRLLEPETSVVQFHQVHDTTIPLRDGTCAAMFSCHVFQHFSNFEGVVEYLRESFRVLVPGSSICFHVPVPGAHRSASMSDVRLAIHNAWVTVRRMLGRRRIMEYHRYSPTVIFKTLQAIGFRDTELRVFNMKSNGDAHSFFFARRP